MGDLPQSLYKETWKFDSRSNKDLTIDPIIQCKLDIAHLIVHLTSWIADISRVENKDFYPVASRAHSKVHAMDHCGVWGSFPGKYEKRWSKWCNSRHIWHIFINFFTLLDQNIFGFSCLSPNKQWPIGPPDSEILWPAHKIQWPWPPGHRLASTLDISIKYFYGCYLYYYLYFTSIVWIWKMIDCILFVAPQSTVKP